MKRYIRLYLYFLRFSFSKAFEFRVDFYFRVIMDITYYFANLGFFAVIYKHTQMLGGWNEQQIYIFVGAFVCVDALHMTIYSNNLWHLPQFINKGDLDYYIVRPVSSLFFLSLREFAANSFINLIFAIGILVWAIANYDQSISLEQYLSFALLIFNGLFLYYIIHMIFIIPVFWTHKADGLINIFYTFGKVMERPDRIFAGPLRVIFLSVLPMSIVASYPSHILLEGFKVEILIHSLIVTAIFFMLLNYLWKKGLKAYSSASS